MIRKGADDTSGNKKGNHISKKVKQKLYREKKISL